MGVYKIYCGDICLPNNKENYMNFYAVMIKNSKGKIIYQNVEHYKKKLPDYILNDLALKEAIQFIEKHKINNFKFKIFVKNKQLYDDIVKSNGHGAYSNYKEHISCIDSKYLTPINVLVVNKIKQDLEKSCLERALSMEKPVIITTDGYTTIGDFRVDMQNMSCDCFYYYFFNKLIEPLNTNITIKCKHILYVEEVLSKIKIEQKSKINISETETEKVGV